MGQGECKPCMPADQTSDTVKVDPTLLAQPLNAKPFNAEAPEKELVEANDDDEEERRRLEAAAKAAEEEAAAAAAASAAAAAAEADAAKAAQEEEAQRAQALAAEKEAADAELRQKQAAEVARVQSAQRERKEAEESVAEFLRKRGFTSISEPRKKLLKKSYALHVAVEENSVAIVQALLLCGADKTLKNSAGKTPREVAMKLNKKGSHDAVVKLLQQ